MKKLIILPLLICSLSSFIFAEEVELLNGETIILIEDEEDLVEEEDNEIYYIEDEEDLWEEDENNTIVPIEDEDEEEDKIFSIIKKILKVLIIKDWKLTIERW